MLVILLIRSFLHACDEFSIIFCAKSRYYYRDPLVSDIKSVETQLLRCLMLGFFVLMGCDLCLYLWPTSALRIIIAYIAWIHCVHCKKPPVGKFFNYINFKNATNITITCCVLHNLFISKKLQRYMTHIAFKYRQKKLTFSKNMDKKLKINFLFFPFLVGGGS